MEIEPTVLLAYAIAWTFFYALLSRHIAELSRQKWTTWVQSEESDDVLVEALQAVIEEIEDRMHDKLEDFKSSFFGSLGAASKKLDQATGQGAIKALTKEEKLQEIAEMIGGKSASDTAFRSARELMGSN